MFRHILSIFFVCFTSFSFAIEYQYNGGHKIPSIGLGTFAVTDEKQLTDTLNKALEIGYRHIDTASAYNNEQLIGNVLKEWISSGKLKREDIFITTKLNSVDMYSNQVENAIKTSLQTLQLDYLDLYLIHNPIAMKHINGKPVPQPTDLISVWKKMEEQVDAGRAKTIGVSNFNITQIERIQKIARIQPVNLQVEIHAYFQQPELREFARKTNITVVAYSPFGSPGAKKFFESENLNVNLSLPDILHDDVVTQIAKKHNKSNAQVLLRYLLQLNIVVIPKSSNPNRLKQNFDIFDFTLDEDDMNALKKLDRGPKGKIIKLVEIFPGVDKHPEYPFHDSL
ncbi:1,5-anhydro-D-fructose reductase-like isoform X1 [Diabrotica virgifera virgifera]|uniref:NADP-dependent oxidoreductase domain-containing protein n=2 Tax=Diabrotica virgifera virgifera TaxID=50390 RepID=A0ABM5JUQ6_DIAVI|nr:1,5-anhydro-D-fructose reductase-like isoform X1 [Diabrotica virgifera virgifera]